MQEQNSFKKRKWSSISLIELSSLKINLLLEQKNQMLIRRITREEFFPQHTANRG